MKAVVFTKYGPPDIIVYLMWDLEYAFKGLISLPRTFPLHEKVFSLRSKRWSGAEPCTYASRTSSRSGTKYGGWSI
jgi:hypothetical protein